MRILYIDWPHFGKENTLTALAQLGHEVVPFFHPDYQKRQSATFDLAFTLFIDDASFDCCFSFNYYPAVSNNCYKFNLKYIAMVYDNPYIMLYSHSILNPNNYVFLFDSTEYIRLKEGGISTVYYSPLPANNYNLPSLFCSRSDCNRFSAEVSFVGSLYHDEPDFFDCFSDISDYTRGYLNGIMDAQLQVYGYNFIEELLLPATLKELQKSVPYAPDGAETAAYIYSNYFINRRLTAIERKSLLSALASHVPLRLYSGSDTSDFPHIQNMGTVDYNSEMPLVFASSKINLNITLRSIQSGIPLRCMDILGAGGFLLTNYQADFLKHFTPNEDFVYYESPEDLIEKTIYYLSHEKERLEIAHNGHEKAIAKHSYEKFFENIFKIVFPK